MILSSSYDKFDSIKIKNPKKIRITPEESKSLLLEHLKLENRLLDILYQDNFELNTFERVINQLKDLRRESYYLLNINGEDNRNKLGNLITIKYRNIDSDLFNTYPNLRKQIKIINKNLKDN